MVHPRGRWILLLGVALTLFGGAKLDATDMARLAIEYSEAQEENHQALSAHTWWTSLLVESKGNRISTG